MNKIQITFLGSEVLVDEDMVSLMLKKQTLVQRVHVLNKIATKEAHEEKINLAVKLIRLNRRIRKNVQFL